ncbi:WYL domain-containing protein [Butyrivibrio fibrisolvens]|uniref:WYL domain-containing protein n=1 Tax=Butyrivibrio fibrisolvens TaxID=831 RepID=UPI0004248F75|nr:WYL domain-containing protein [Butyrivibrio fibrisolvens]
MAKKDYKQIVLSYLLQHADENINRDTLIAETGISKSRLSEILASIRKDGYTITTPPRSGIIKLEQCKDQVVLPAIKDSDIRQWLIIFLLSRYGSLSFRELVLKTLSIKEYDPEYTLKINDRKAYDDNNLIKSLRSQASSTIFDEDIDVAGDYISITTLRKDLTDLRKKSLVTLKSGHKSTYKLTSKAPNIITISEDSLYEFCQKHEEYLSTTSELLPAKQAYNKIKKLIAWDGSEYKQRRFGKINQISENQIDKFNNFINHPYKTKRITLHSEYNGKVRHDTVSVGLLFYSVETNVFYALCYNHTQNRIEADRLEYIGTIIDEEQPNTIYHSKKYYQIYNEMFGAGFDKELYHVKVLVSGYSHNKERFTILRSIRENALFREIPNPPDGCIYKYVYEDDIRGLDDFARFLRSFGYSVLALEPPQLKEKMIESYNKIIEKNQKLDGISNE